MRSPSVRRLCEGRRSVGRDDTELSSKLLGTPDPRGNWPRSVEYRGKTYWINDPNRTTDRGQIQMGYSAGNDLLSIRADNWGTPPPR